MKIKETIRLTKEQMIYLAVIFLLAFGIIGFLYYLEIKEDQRHFELFLNHFYFSVDHSLGLTESLIKANPVPVDDNLDERIDRLQHSLMENKFILNNGHYYVNDNIPYGVGFFLAMSAEVQSMDDENKLDQEERDELQDIRKVLKDIKKGMYSSKTHQEKPNMSVDEFQSVMAPYDGGPPWNF